MKSLLFGVARNGLAKGTAALIKAVDLMAEATPDGHYVIMLVIAQALRSANPTFGGSFWPRRT